MRRIRKISVKSLVFMVLFVILFCGSGTMNAEAAMKKSQAIQLYNRVISRWGASGKRVKVVSSLHDDKSGVSCRKKGKMTSTAMLYDGMPRFIFKNLGGDATPEALFYSSESRNIYVFTIKNKKVKSLGAICCDCYGTGVATPKIYYNSRKKTVSIVARPHVRTTVQKVYKISGTRLKCVSTVSRYVGPMNANGSNNIRYYVNNKKKSYASYKNAWKKYLKQARRIQWGP